MPATSVSVLPEQLVHAMMQMKRFKSAGQAQRFLAAHDGPVAKFENGREMGRAGPHFTTTIRGQPSLKAEPIRPFPGLLTNFATGPCDVDPNLG